MQGNIPVITDDLVDGISAEQEIAGANTSFISIRRLIITSYAAKYYLAVGRTMPNVNMHSANVLKDFKVDWEAYMTLKDNDAHQAASISDKDNDRKVIKRAPILKDCISHTFGHRGPLIYGLREEETVEDEELYPFQIYDTTCIINSYFCKSGSL